MPNLIFVRIGMLGKKLARHQHKARCTEAALRRAALDEGLLHRRELAVGREALDRRHLGTVGKDGEHQTARYRAPVEEHGAAAA